MKFIKRTAFLIALLLLLSLSLFSCSKEESETVFAYGDTVMREDMYLYELSAMKSELLAGNGVTGQDIPAVWTTEIAEGTTYDDLIYAQCQMNICSVLYFADYAKKNGGELDDTDHDTIDKTLDGIVSQLGSKRAVNEYLKDYGIDYDTYREYLELYALYTNGVELAYAEDGARAITYEKMLEYFREKFVTVKHIAIGTELAGTDEEGNYIYFTEEEKLDQQKKIEDIRERLALGEDFDTLYPESEDGQSALYPNGYTLTAGVLSEDMQGYEKAATGLEIGEVAEWEKEGIAHYFIQRVELLESDFANCENYIYPILIEQDMASAVLENYSDFTMNDEIIDSYNMASVPVMQ